MSKLYSIPFCTATVFMSVKDITWLLNSFRSLWRPWKNFVYQLVFLVYGLIASFTISDGIKWHQNSIVFNIFSRWGRHSFRSFIRCIRFLSGLSGYDLTHYHDQAVDKNNTEGHSPYANVNYINLCLLYYDCLDLPRRSKTSKAKHRSAKDWKYQKIVTRLSRFIDLR